MRKTRYNLTKLFIFLLVILTVLTLLIKYSSRVGESKKVAINARAGVIDLRGWDFSKDGIVKLQGEWEYYDNNLLEPKDFEGALQSVKKYNYIPGYFEDNGYGTYKLKILVDNKTDIYSIRIDFLQSAYKLWANGREVISVGTVSKDKNTMKPQLLPKSGGVYAQNGEIDLVLQVSNFYSKYSYVDNISIGEYSQINKYNNIKLAFDLFIFGGTFVAAIYNFGLFIKRKKDKSTLYFAIVCLIVAIRTLFLGERFFICIFPDFSYFISGKIMHWTFYLYIPFIVLFINEFYKGILTPKVVKGTKYSAYIYGILVLLSPWKYYSDLIFPFEVLTMIILLYLIFKISKVYVFGNQSDHVIVIALFSLLLTRINDILYEYSIILTGSFAPLGTLIFIVCSSFILAERQSLALSNIEDMSEKLKSLNNLKDDFLAMTSHELKTPLNGIIGLSESLINGNSIIYFEQKEDLLLINSSAKRLSNLVNDIMIFSKLKNGNVILCRKPVNIKKAVDIVIKFSNALNANKNIKIENLIEGDVPYVFGDEDRVQQIFYNLIGNAIKFTHKGKITISYKIINNFIEICIQDTGIGIPKDKLNKIFSIYEQVDGIGEKYGGTGLGLYITKNLIELHGGSIHVSSKEGEGSVFSFTLPLCSEEQLINDEISFYDNYIQNKDYNETLGKNVTKEINDASKKNKILIVDDEYINHKVLEGFLKGDKFSIVNAYNGKDALKVLEDQKDFDLIILDMMMPDLLGYEVCNFVREKYSLFELPILIMTADNKLENLVVSFECGANDYLVKPFNKHELNARINTLIALKQSVSKEIKLIHDIAKANKKVKNLNEKNIESSRKVEELMEYDKLRTEFFTNLSHELRTPLNVICSTIQLMGTLSGDTKMGEDKIKYYLSIMNQNSLRLLRLINNLIDMTKVNGGYISLNLVKGNIIYAVEEITQSVAEYIKSKNIAITFDTDVEEKIICYDEEKLERIMLNILSNAVKFTNEGGSIDVNVYDKDEFVEISVKDSGIGIPEDKLEFIFERFAQVDKSMTRRSEGSGIGLSLVKSLVEMHGGKIEAKSKLGEGTEFIIMFPSKTVASENINNDFIYKEVPESKFDKSLNIEFSDIYM
ncbi:ATPase/histidine kinase/DNA gyrase B/HSP90 domain protein [Clostridiales bacterium oral taxon 876 str. F0540]|nr:ATPase/histidine kinase/DNA gyrase B/HSP90 domain protein [Clostridiales bacterium oral taxon 876 str. F0540]